MAMSRDYSCHETILIIETGKVKFLSNEFYGFRDTIQCESLFSLSN